MAGVASSFVAVDNCIMSRKGRERTAAVALVLFLVPGCRGEKVKSTPLAESAMKAEIVVREVPLRASPATAIRAAVTIRNRGTGVWPAEGNPDLGGRVNLSYHWLDQAGHMIEFDGIRSALPKPLCPNEEAAITARILVPVRPGSYILQFDLVQEWVAWFGVQGASVPIIVDPSHSQNPAR